MTTVKLYKTNLKTLHSYMRRGTGDSKAANDLRDIMDLIWEDLTTKEKKQMREYSAKLNEESE